MFGFVFKLCLTLKLWLLNEVKWPVNQILRESIYLSIWFLSKKNMYNYNSKHRNNLKLKCVSQHLVMQPGKMSKIWSVFTGQLKMFHSMFLSSRCRMKACSIPFRRKRYVVGRAVFLRKRGKKCGGEVVERLKNVIVFICGLCVGCRKPRGPGLSLFVIEWRGNCWRSLSSKTGMEPLWSRSVAC